MRIELRPRKSAEKFQPYLDTFLLSGCSKPLGGVLVLPGGGYSGRAAHEGDPVAQTFNALGYHAFVLQYRTSIDGGAYPDPQQDLIRAIRIIRAHAEQWRLDKIAVLGFSAGGHLAASGTLLAGKINADENDEYDRFSGQADAMILCYPVISLTDEWAHRGSANNLFGENTSDEVKAQANAHLLIDANTPPAFLWHTATDGGVPVRNSVAFAEKMWENGRRCELHVFPEGPHGRGLGLGIKDIRQWPELAAVFLETTVGFTRS